MANAVSVLWIDDTAGMALIYGTLLTALGVPEVMDANTAADGFAFALHRRFNLILIDFELPDGDGLALAGRIRQTECASSGARLVLVTGHDVDSLARLPGAVHVDAIMTKPVTAKAIRAQLLQLPVFD